MSFAELFLIAVGLSMDAFAAALSDGLLLKRRRTAVVIAAMFGLFQAGMPVIGYLLGAGFAGLISAWDHYIALAVLGFIGGKMVIESISELRRERKARVTDIGCVSEADVSCNERCISFPVILAQAAATSIDALIVGVSFAAIGTEILPAAAFIGTVTFAICLAGALWGRCCGLLFGTKAQLLGGLVLIGIGVKTAAEHLWF